MRESGDITTEETRQEILQQKTQDIFPVKDFQEELKEKNVFQ